MIPRFLQSQSRLTRALVTPVKLNSLFCLCLFAFSLTLVGGCGGGSEPTVITPGEDYQLNEQEQENLRLEAEARKGR